MKFTITIRMIWVHYETFLIFRTIPDQPSRVNCALEVYERSFLAPLGENALVLYIIKMKSTLDLH